MPGNAQDWGAIDAALAGVVDAAPADRRWLLIQTLATSAARRVLLNALPFQAGWRIVDLGCGYGASAMELAALRPATVIGIDTDADVLGLARTAAGTAAAASASLAASSVAFVESNAYAVPLAGASVDGVVSRFVFQHLARPADAIAELHRVVRPGGLVCLVDVDDGLSISEPAPSEAYQRMAAALAAGQGSSGGDRRIGRRMAGLLDAGGFEPFSVLALPQAAYRRSNPDDPDRLLLLERLRAARCQILAGGAVTAEAFDADLAALAVEQTPPTFEAEAHLAVAARRR